MIKKRTSDLFVYFRRTQIKTSLQSLELGLGSHVKNPEREESRRKIERAHHLSCIMGILK